MLLSCPFRTQKYRKGATTPKSKMGTFLQGKSKSFILLCLFLSCIKGNNIYQAWRDSHYIAGFFCFCLFLFCVCVCFLISLPFSLKQSYIHSVLKFHVKIIFFFSKSAKLSVNLQ